MLILRIVFETEKLDENFILLKGKFVFEFRGRKAFSPLIELVFA